MIYKTRKRIAARLMKCSPKRVRLDATQLDDIKEALTKSDIRGLINDGVIRSVQKKGVSRGRAREKHLKKRKGQRSGQGKRKGRATARTPKKETWMKTVRLQRAFLGKLKAEEKISKSTYREMYLKSKGGFFRSRRHIKIYLTERNLIDNGKKKT